MPRASALDLPAFALSSPLQAEEQALELLAEPTTVEERTYAWQALGIVARESGRTAEAIAHFRRAVNESRRAGLSGRTSDLLASLATALAIAGRRPEALASFDQSLQDIGAGAAAARVLVRRSAVWLMYGEHENAYEDARRAVRALARRGDAVWLARAHVNAAEAMLRLGRLDEADREHRTAQRIAEESDQAYVVAMVVHGRADCAYRRGDLPRALRLLLASQHRYAALGMVPFELLRDRVKVLSAAMLVPEAVSAAEELVTAVNRDRSGAAARAEGHILAARAYLMTEPARARELAVRASLACRRQGDPDGERHARLVDLRAQELLMPASRRLARAAGEVATSMRDRHSTERLDALLLAGDLHADVSLTGRAVAYWQEAATYRRRGSALRRAGGWLAKARLAGARGDRRRLLGACDAGLDVLEAHRRSLGSTELQARATEHGRELAALAIREVLRAGTGRDLLRWTERWRATVLDRSSSRPIDDPEDVRDLAALRELALDSPDDKASASAIDRERIRLEERVRQRAHARAGSLVATGAPASVDAIVSSLDDDTALVAIARVDGIAHVVVARNGRVRRFQAGVSDEIDQAAEFARFALRSVATGDEATASAMTAALEDQTGRLQELLLGPAVRALGDGPVVMVPPATLQSIPWDALPALRDRPISVSPSASAWLRSCQATRPRRRRVALIVGARLESAGAEVPELARTYRRPTVLSDGAATCDAAMKALDGAWLAHVAAHGTIRTDNPMFSALELDDGPLTVYDLERLRRAPYRLVLSVCESAVGAATGADELLGLSSALIGLGTAGLLASIVPVNDEATVPFSLTIHERLRAGDDLATALMHARRAAGDDPVARATAYSFLALGAA
jgi:CHAT domain-containing protein